MSQLKKDERKKKLADDADISTGRFKKSGRWIESWSKNNNKAPRGIIKSPLTPAPRGASSGRPAAAAAARHDVPSGARDIISVLPKLEPVAVRRFRIPRYEAVILELEEQGLGESAAYVRMLVELDEKIIKKAGPAARKTGRLKSEKNILQRLGDGLRSAEIAKKNGDESARAAVMMELAIFFESEGYWQRFWIAEELYKSCIKIASGVQGQIFNVVKYLYGRFLLDKMNNPKEALEHLDQVRIDSEGKTWNVSKILGLNNNGETLYKECCALLHRALLSLSRHVRKRDPQLSIQPALYALERATDSVRDQASALYELGKSQLSAGHVEMALGNLSKFLAISKRIPDPESICNAHMELAFARKELEDSDGTVKHLGLLRQCAMRYNLSYELAQAHYYTGEYLLNKSQANLATPHLNLARAKFSSLGKNDEADRARCAAGISKGQEVMDRYIDLIFNCRKMDDNTEAIIKICNWKNERIPFW